MKPIPYGRQEITEEDIQAVANVLRSDFLTQGPSIEQFEKEFAAYIGVKYAVAVSNGTAALHLAVMALNIRPGQRVITTPITFAASANCVRYCGGEIDFCDIDPNTFLIDINLLEKKLAAKPMGYYSGIIPVDFAGKGVDLEKIAALAKKYKLWILEDACHAPGGYFISSSGKQHLCGNSDWADAAIFSFHPVKHIATAEGGMVTTNNEEVYKKLLLLRTHGITKDPKLLKENHGGWYYEMQELGYNYRLTDMQATLGISQLKRAQAGLARRRIIADRYRREFKSLPQIILPQSDEGHAYHLFVIQVADRKALYDYLREQQIFAQVHYVPVHTMPYYQSLGWKKGDMPTAEKYYAGCLSLPMYPSLKDEEQEYVIESVKNFFERK